ncbi:MAG TPA: hypothetical protein VEK57_25945 [Thermoanaerobaculia bacterium]|nr:hypothetical protein [Thermoanaerobaculia bacterium]
MLARFLTILLFLVSTASAQAPVPSHARQPVAEPVTRPVRVAYEPYVVTNGDGFLALWEDDRYGNTDVFGARFGAEGELLDRSGFTVRATWRPDYQPRAVWDGQRYLTLAVSEHMGTFPVAVGEDGAVEPAGQLLPVHLAFFQRTLAWNGERYATVMSDTSDGTVSFVLLNRELQVTTRTPIPSSGNVRTSRVATDGREFLLVWESIRGHDNLVSAQRFSAGGEAIGTTQLLASIPVPEWFWDLETYEGRMEPAVSWNGNAFVAVWTTPDGVYGARIAAGRDTEPFRITAEAEPANAAIAWDGIAHLVVWNRRLEFSYVQPSAALLSGTGIVGEIFPVGPQTYGGRPSLASNGKIFLLFVDGERFVIRPWSTPRIVKEERFTSDIYAHQFLPAIASGTANTLTAWQEDGAIYAGRLSRGGQPLDGSGIRIAGISTHVRTIRIASAGDTYLVVWEDSGVHGARVTADGELLDAGGFDIAPGGFMPLAAARGDSFLVAWQEPGSQVYGLTIATAAIPATGAVEIQERSPAVDIGFLQTPIALLPSAAGYQLVWQQDLGRSCPRPFCTDVAHEQRLMSLTADGNQAATYPLLRDQQIQDAILEDGSLFAVVQGGDRFSPRFFVYRFNLAGETLGEPAELPQDVLRARMARSAGGPVVLYSVATTPAPLPDVEIRAIFLDRGGQPKAPPVTVLSGADAPTLSDVSSDGTHVWLAYTARWYPLPQSHTGVVNRAYVARLAGRVRAAGR